MKFILCTGNSGKVVEFGNVLTPLGIEVIPIFQTGVKYKMPKEIGDTFQENAEIKAETAFSLTGISSIGDDSGLVVECLDGEPGIFSKRYAGENATDAQNINKLLDKMRDIPLSQRIAKFVCYICCIINSETKLFAYGECQGKIAFLPKGDNGFGYDSVFIAGSGKTFAEISLEKKNKISHRGRAINNLYDQLKNIINIGVC